MSKIYQEIVDQYVGGTIPRTPTETTATTVTVQRWETDAAVYLCLSDPSVAASLLKQTSVETRGKARSAGLPCLSSSTEIK